MSQFRPTMDIRLRVAKLVEMNTTDSPHGRVYKQGWTDQTVAAAVDSRLTNSMVNYIRRQMYPVAEKVPEPPPPPVRQVLPLQQQDDRIAQLDSNMRSFHATVASYGARHKTLRDDFEAHVARDLEVVTRSKTARVKHNMLCALLAEVFGDDRFKECMIEKPEANGKEAS